MACSLCALQLLKYGLALCLYSAAICMHCASKRRVNSPVPPLQVLLWRPAELLNGRLAMIGFTAAVANEAITGASLWQQLYYAPYAYLSAYLLVVVAAQLNKAFGSPSQGVGPFTRTAEIINGR